MYIIYMNIYLYIINSKRNECAKISPNSSFKIFLKKNLENETDNLQNLLSISIQSWKYKIKVLQICSALNNQKIKKTLKRNSNKIKE